MSKNAPEPLLEDNPNRYVMFPIKDHDIWQLYKKMFDCMWRAEEIDLSKDMVHWEKLTDNERHFIKMVLAFFAASDGIVVENLGMRFLSEVQLREHRSQRSDGIFECSGYVGLTTQSGESIGSG